MNSILIESYQKFHEAYVPCGEDIQIGASDFVDPGAKTEKFLLSIFWGNTIKICVSELAFSNALYIDDDIVYIAIFSISECVSR